MDRFQLFACLPALLLVSIFSAHCDDPYTGDKYNCSLNASAPFASVVMILDLHSYADATRTGGDGTASMGSLITCCAVLTTAYYYVNNVLNDQSTFNRFGKWDRLRVIGQYIYDRSSGTGREHPCYQNVSVVNVLPHPKTSTKGERILFDFAVVVMAGPFNVISPTFPTMFFPTSTLELLLRIRYVNVIQSETFCTMPTPVIPDKRGWIFADRVEVRSKPFHTQCAKRFCEQKLGGGRGSKEVPECERIFGERLNATMLCMIPYWQRLGSLQPNPDGSLYPNALAGSPLICNGTTLGMSNFVKTRAREYYPQYQQDMFFTITLLRVLPWLTEKIKEYTPVLDPFYIEDQTLARVDFPDPSRLPTEDWGYKNFVTLPPGDNPFPPIAKPDSLAPPTFCCSVFSKTLFTSFLLHIWHSF